MEEPTAAGWRPPHMYNVSSIEFGMAVIRYVAGTDLTCVIAA